jgi:lantibiotic biosynthesis protein
MTGEHPAGKLSGAVADLLAHPGNVPGSLTSRPWWRQSLAHGAPGVALLHIEHAAAGLASWQRAHDWLTCVARTPVTAGADSHLFYGAPALAHALACAAAHRPGSYARALDALDQAIAAHARVRADQAHSRIDAGQLPALAEFDVIRGLTGVGSYLLRRDPEGKAVRAVLEYLVRLTEPVTVDGQTLPGWWTAAGPSGRESDRFVGGHSNLGVAHGIGGPLALLARALRQGITVAGHRAAIGRICGWLDRWCADSVPAWPYWVNRPQFRAGRREFPGPQRLGWCYGTAGLARAQQLAALAIGDSARRTLAEHALIQALADPAQRALTTGPSLCHGYAGLAHIAAVAAADAGPATADRLRALVPGLLDAVQPAGIDPGFSAACLLGEAGCGPGFLEGASGVALAVMAPSFQVASHSGWDTCLLIARDPTREDGPPDARP